MKTGEYSGVNANFERINDGLKYEKGVSNPWNNRSNYSNTHVEIIEP